MSRDRPMESSGAHGLPPAPSYSRGSGQRVGNERASYTGNNSYKPRGSASQWGPGAAGPAPRMSQQGSRRSHRQSARSSKRGSQMGDGGGQQMLQVLDDEGFDRTPKPLMAIKPTVVKGGVMGLAEDITSSPASETSDFFLDRMSSAAFSRIGGAAGFGYSESGTQTPKSEFGDGDYEVIKEARKMAAAAAAAEEAAEEAEVAAAKAEAAAEERDRVAHATEPELLTERDLEGSVAITLSETSTDFLLVMAGVTVAGDSEAAKVVEAANARYAALLTTKQAADKYTDQETQTLAPLHKAREVQAGILTTTTTGCQATIWDLADTYDLLEQATALQAAAGGEGGAGGEGTGGTAAVAGTGPGAMTVDQLAGAVARGEGYGAGVGGGSRSTNPQMGHSFARTESTANSTIMASWAHNPMVARVTGMMPGSMGGNRPTDSARTSATGIVTGPDTTAGLPQGEPMDTTPGPPPDPLAGLPSLLDALTTMDCAVCQNAYLPALLQYRDVHRQQFVVASEVPAPVHAQLGGDGSSTSRAASVAPSRPLSRVASKTNLSEQASMLGPSDSVLGPAPTASMNRAMSMAMSQMGGMANKAMSVAGSEHGGRMSAVPGYAASVAESHWPEELLQEMADLGPDGVPRLEHLWDWTCPQVEGRTVACISWNKRSPDLLAVGYGTLAFSKAAAASGLGGGGAIGGEGGDGGKSIRGRVAFWSLKNPAAPMWSFETRAGVTSLDFSRQQPNILAVGLYDGTVAVYDVKARTGTPASEADANTGRHSDPVWQVRWVDRGPERDEPLMSISTDGRVTQWSIAKGLEFTDLMKLKRVPRKGGPGGMPGTPANGAVRGGAGDSARSQGAGGKGGAGKGGAGAGGGSAAAAAAGGGENDAFISRLTSGLCFDFSSRDERMYIAGTEDGWVHRCSTSYSEQYLESYEGHMGPVYALQWSPFRSDMFLSASADWTLRLWQEGRPQPLLLFTSGVHEVADAQWCPGNATVFGAANSDGRMEIWDFDMSTVKPVVTHKAGVALTCLLFAANSPVVVCGTVDGKVQVLRLYNVHREYDTPEEQLSRLDDVIRQNVMKAQPGAMA